VGIFTHHEPCPKCGSRDNLAVYSDGGAYCFGCHHTISAKVSGFVKQREEACEEVKWSLPDDLTQDYPQEVLDWIKKYDITVEELIKYHGYFSKRTGRLWSLLGSVSTGQFCSSMGRKCSAAEARQCNGSIRGPKALFYGSKEETFAYTGTQLQTGHLVLCEDRLSSIKIGRITHAMALFGTSISMSKTARVAQTYKKVTVWLDHDKFQEAWEIALKFKWLGVNTKVLLTPLDPKCYSNEEIKEYLK